MDRILVNYFRRVDARVSIGKDQFPAGHSEHADASAEFLPTEPLLQSASAAIKMTLFGETCLPVQ